jgi:ABC-type lipoprotein export system ATPase subunit
MHGGPLPLNQPQQQPDATLPAGEQAGYAPPTALTALTAPTMRVVADGLSKSFRVGSYEVLAVERVSCSFAAGQFVAILGKSGSGKSTLLYLLGGLDKPSAGTLLVDGIDVARLSGAQEHRFRREKLGFVFQFFHLIPHLTALENVTLPMELKGGMTDEELRERAHALLTQVGVDEKRRQHKPSQLSGGQQQRVAIARALANDPKVILADEPTGNVDTHTGKIIIQLLKQLTAHGRTVIVVTHDTRVAQVADVCLQMEDGRLTTMVNGSPSVTSKALSSKKKRVHRR